VLTLAASVIVAAAVVWSAIHVAGQLRAARDAKTNDRQAVLLQLFAPAIAAARHDPRAYLVWQPIAKTARQLFPADCAAIDRAAGGTFPFAAADIETAHAQWTTEWLAWERAHDAEYKLKAAQAQAEFAASGGSDAARARADAIEREKLDLYQRRYAEYVRVAKALQALSS
jgi:hypothetical protein